MADFTQAQYDALNAAIANGTTQVRFADRTVQYRSIDEMMRVRRLMARELNIARAPNRTFATLQKGLAK